MHKYLHITGKVPINFYSILFYIYLKPVGLQLFIYIGSYNTDNIYNHTYNKKNRHIAPEYTNSA
jgi:hypothetical protein